MSSCGYSLSMWIFALLCSCLQLWGGVSPSETAPPAPSLFLSGSQEGSLVLVCTISGGGRGVEFELYKHQEWVHTVSYPEGSPRARFTLSKDSWNQSNPFCCRFKNQQGNVSPYSIYMYPKEPDSGPWHRRPPQTHAPPPPVLSVEPPGGQAKRGQNLSFHCAPPHSWVAPRPVSFLLLRTPAAAAAAGGSRGAPVPPLASQSEALRLGPVRGGEGGSYTCLYQVLLPGWGLTNSTTSTPVHVIITDMLPVPTLSFQRHQGVWLLTCTGSPAFPGSRFSLYGASFEATLRAPADSHRVTFQVSPPAGAGTYQCRYFSRLADDWAHSEHSLPLALPTDTGPSEVDWPLVLGSVSAVVLFCSALGLMGLMVHKRVAAAAEQKKKREETVFWTQVKAKDHVVDLTLKRISFSSQTQELGSGDNTAETAFRPHPWRDMATFHGPPAH